MVRVAKKKGGGGGKKGGRKYEPVNSDSENDHYDDFDPKNPFGDDEIEQFHNDKDKILLKGVNKPKKSEFVDSSEEEEVFAFDESDEESDAEYEEGGKGMDVESGEDDDEEEGNNEEGDESNLIKGSWGSRKSAYYSGNRLKTDEDAELEEEEAKLLQAKMMKELDSSDFGLDAFQSKSRRVLKTGEELAAEKLAETHLGVGEELDEENLERVMKNLSKMSKKEKIDFLKQESPELFELVRDFKEKIDELESSLLPVYRYIKQGNGVQQSLASEYIINKTKLYLMYCAHLSFYFVLKSKRVSIENHPIVKNILQYRNLCKQIEKIDDKLEDEVNLIRSSIENGQQLSFLKPSQLKQAQQKVKKSVHFRDSLALNKRDQKLEFDDEENDKAPRTSKEEANGEEGIEGEEEEAVQKRAINYEIEKNKGLTPKRPKSYRNPRVRNRLKARKAHIKHKSIVPKVRSQEKRYTGEATGIRMGVVRGVKIK